MSPLSNAERQRRWRQRLRARAAAITISDRDPDDMGAEERCAEVATLANVLRANLCKLLPVAVRIRYVTRSMDVGEPGSGLLEDPETTIEDLIARIDRKMTGDSEKPKKKRKAKKK